MLKSIDNIEILQHVLMCQHSMSSILECCLKFCKLRIHSKYLEFDSEYICLDSSCSNISWLYFLHCYHISHIMEHILEFSSSIILIKITIVTKSQISIVYGKIFLFDFIFSKNNLGNIKLHSVLNLLKFRRMRIARIP